MVDGSNESFYHANEEFDPNLCTGVPLQKSSEKVDVILGVTATKRKRETSDRRRDHPDANLGRLRARNVSLLLRPDN